MPNYTDTLNLKLTDMETDGDELFLFDEDLNDNFEKIDLRFESADIVLSSTDWKGASAPYTQTVAVEGMTEDINPHVSLIHSSDYSTSQTEQSEYSKLYKGETAENSITFYATSPAGVDLNLRLKRL